MFQTVTVHVVAMLLRDRDRDAYILDVTNGGLEQIGEHHETLSVPITIGNAEILSPVLRPRHVAWGAPYLRR